MAEKFDVASRLAEGRPAVDNIGNYVWACHLLGYQDPDLTLHAAQVRDWYSSEDGLDLRALDADCAALEAAVAATETALRQQDDQLAVLSGAWDGAGADASREFLRRHGEASGASAAAVRTAADALTALRDNLWHMVDGKVAAALAIDDRRQAERADWLAAAQTVNTGAGDRAVASELIDQQVKPFVDNDIRTDWLTAMRTTMASVAASYDAATAGLTAEPAATFEVPADLGPSWTPPPITAPAADEPKSTDRGGVATSPAAVVSAPPVTSMPASPMPAAAPPAPPPMPMSFGPAVEPPPAAPAAPPPAMPAAPMGGLGGGLPGVGGGLSGLGQQLADALGALLKPLGDALPGTPGSGDPPKLGDSAGPGAESAIGRDDKPADEKTGDGKNEPAKPADETTGDGKNEPAKPAADKTGNGCNDQPADGPPPAEPAPTPAPLPPPLAPPPAPAAEPPPSPAAATKTPCEIAADELPQAGQ
jgi:hypothetical protein